MTRSSQQTPVCALSFRKQPCLRTQQVFLHSRVLADNVAALKVQAKAGFERAGREAMFSIPQGREMEVIRTCLTRESFCGQPANPAFGSWNPVA